MIINRLDVKAKEKPNFLSFLLLGQAEDTWHTLKKKEIYLIRFGLALSLDILMYLLFGCGRVCIDSSFLSVYSLYLPPLPSLLPSLFFSFSPKTFNFQPCILNFTFYKVP